MNLRLMSFLLVLICYVLLVALLFYYLERAQNWSFGDAFYFTWVMITTVGYGDLSPESTEGRLLLIILFAIGAIIMVTFLGVVQHILSFYLHSFVTNLVPLTCCGGRVLSSGKINCIELVFSMLLLFVWMVLGWAAFQTNEPAFTEFRDFIYASIITFTTIGYGDKAPTTQTGRICWFLYMVPGLALMAMLLGYLDTLIHDQNSADNKKKDVSVKKRLRDLNGINTVALKRTVGQLERYVERSLAGSELHQKIE